MRLIQLTDEQAVWLHGVMQNPLSEDPNPANEDPVDAANRRAVFEATKAPLTEHVLTYEEMQRVIDVNHSARVAHMKGIDIGFDAFQAECGAIWRRAGGTGEGTFMVSSTPGKHTLFLVRDGD